MQSDSAHTGRRVAFVTGSARRIGAAIARGLHTAGMNVAVHYNTSAAAAGSLVEELNEQRADSALAIQADLLDFDAGSLVNTVVDRFGRLDVVVNNASSFYATPLASVNDEGWRDLMGTNLRAPLFLARAAVAHLRDANGSIVNLIDINADKPLPDYSIYCAAKAGLIALTRSLARELGPEIRVNAVSPGAILWPEAQPPGEQEKAHLIEQTPLARLGEVRDIVDTVRFLALEAPFITGQVINVDGGRSLT